MESVSTQDVVVEGTKIKNPTDMDDHEIAECIKQKGTTDDCKFVYDPSNPCFPRFSYGTFTNCAIPRISMCFTKENPKIIREAIFTNVDFGSCLFQNVVFYQCFFDNCNFSNTVIMDLTFELCVIKNTDVSYKNVVVK